MLEAILIVATLDPSLSATMSATAEATASGAAPWLEMGRSLLLWLAQQPLAWTLALPALTEAVKRGLPRLAAGPAGLVRGIAILLGAIAGVLMAWAQGDLSTVEMSLAQLQEALLAILGAFGVYNLRPGTWGRDRGL